MKEWFTAKELADLNLRLLPSTDRNIQLKASRENWKSRPRSGRGGGKEYHISNLPEAARIQLAAMTAPKIGTAEPQKEAKKQNLAGLADYAHIDGKAKSRIDAKIEILEAFDAFRTRLGYAETRARYLFSELYNCGDIAVEDWIKHTVVSICPASLRNWKSVLSEKGVSGLAGEYGARKGKGLIDTNEEIKNLILGILYQTPHVSAKFIMRSLRARFPNAELPSYRTVQDWLKKWKEANAQTLLAIKNPDAWRSKYKSASGSASAHIVRLNQCWEYDGTPTDIMLNDGKRYNIVGIIDVWSRRLSLFVASSATALAVGAATRKAILKWGVPETVKTDNGKDYVSAYIKRVFNLLEIKQVICPPFSPEKKPHIERVFETFSHGLLEGIEGFIGHDVVERKDIEARKAFSQRLFGKSESISANMSPQELQNFCDDWCETVYKTEVHSGLKMSPAEKAATYTGEIRTISDERALDILLARAPGKDGLRQVSKKGISYEGGNYVAAELGGLEGQQVRILLDETEYGAIYVFDLDGKFIAKALCYENLGISLQEVAMARSAVQKRTLKIQKDAMKQIAQKANVKGNQLVKEILQHRAEESGKLTYMPQKSLSYETEALVEAAKAVVSGEPIRAAEVSPQERQMAIRLQEQQKVSKKVVELETPATKFKRWNNIRDRIFSGGDFTDEERDFYENWQRSAEFRVFQKMEDTKQQQVAR